MYTQSLARVGGGVAPVGAAVPRPAPPPFPTPWTAAQTARASHAASARSTARAPPAVRKNGVISASVIDCRANGGGLVGKGCVGQVTSAGHVALRNRSLFDRPERLARHTIEHEEESVLGGLRNSVDRLPLVTHRDELRRGGEVVVPQIVVHDLEMPESLAGARIERDQRSSP